MKNKKCFSETAKCVKCGSKDYQFLIRDSKGKILRCNQCPQEVKRAMRLRALLYYRILDWDN